MNNKKNNKELSGVKEIARRANVAIATVDRVLHNRPGVSAKTLAKVSKIIEEINYQPNIMARRLASRKVFDFAILIPEVTEESGYFWKYPLDGIDKAEAEIKTLGVNVRKFFYDQNNKNSFIAKSNELLRGKFDGILIAPFFIEESIDFLRKCEKKNIPYVFINSDIPDQKSLCYIGLDLEASGHVAGHLISYLIGPGDDVLVVNISKEIKSPRYNRLLRKEEGMRMYFQKNSMTNEIQRLNITQTDDAYVGRKIEGVLKKRSQIKLIFVTNSRVSSVALYLKNKGIRHIKVVGYDFVEANTEYLREGFIDFLICQKPREQGYKGIMALYHSLVLGLPVNAVYHMPIDIVTKENFLFYEK